MSPIFILSDMHHMHHEGHHPDFLRVMVFDGEDLDITDGGKKKGRGKKRGEKGGKGNFENLKSLTGFVFHSPH